MTALVLIALIGIAAWGGLRLVCYKPAPETGEQRLERLGWRIVDHQMSITTNGKRRIGS